MKEEQLLLPGKGEESFKLDCRLNTVWPYHFQGYVN